MRMLKLVLLAMLMLVMASHTYGQSCNFPAPWIVPHVYRGYDTGSGAVPLVANDNCYTEGPQVYEWRGEDVIVFSTGYDAVAQDADGLLLGIVNNPLLAADCVDPQIMPTLKIPFMYQATQEEPIDDCPAAEGLFAPALPYISLVRELSAWPNQPEVGSNFSLSLFTYRDDPNCQGSCCYLPNTVADHTHPYSRVTYHAESGSMTSTIANFKWPWVCEVHTIQPEFLEECDVPNPPLSCFPYSTDYEEFIYCVESWTASQ